jgi:hypothetical protein
MLIILSGFRPLIYHPEDKVLKTLLLLSFVSLFAFCAVSCAGFRKASEELPPSEQASAGDSGFWDTRPRDGKLILIGGTAPRLNRDEAIQFALLDAARKISIYRNVSGQSVSAVSVGEGAYDFYADAAVEINFDVEYEKYVEELEFDPKTDVLEIDGSLFIRTRWTPPVPLDISFFSSDEDQPDWVRKPPETIGSFLVGVGRSNPYSRRHDTMRSSCENAIGSILTRIGSNVCSGLASVESTDYTAVSSSNIQKAEGSLSQFYVLEIWTDPKDKSIWTLAIAREGDSQPPALSP